MGLDMYLYIERHEYCSQYINDGDLELKYPKDITDFIQTKDMSISRHTHYQVGYWRKANHIHKWFVDICAKGIDDCEPIYLNIEQLKDLLDICKKVQADHSLAPKLLPTQSGFFFGSIDYDEYYFKDIEDTIKFVEPIIKFMESKSTEYTWRVYYEASW